MKFRNGFVSNSSSSSFIVVSTDRNYQEELKDKFEDKVLVIDGSGELSSPAITEFGWGPERIDDVESKINFCYLQCLYSQDTYWLKRLEDVVKDFTGAESIEWRISTDGIDKKDVWGYIDHQSSAPEGKNTGMFSSAGKLKRFIFGKGSFIQLDNDNH
jgi:hypothetical protein